MHALTDRRLCLFYHIDILFRHLLICHVDRLRISQTGIPPFLLGLTWSSTERMSSQQADIMTSELTALRRTLTPVVEKVCTMWLRMHGYYCPFQLEWEEINLQDQVEEAKAALYRQQARKLEGGEDASAQAEDASGDPEENTENKEACP